MQCAASLSMLTLCGDQLCLEEDDIAIRRIEDIAERSNWKANHFRYHNFLWSTILSSSSTIPVSHEISSPLEELMDLISTSYSIHNDEKVVIWNLLDVLEGFLEAWTRIQAQGSYRHCSIRLKKPDSSVNSCWVLCLQHTTTECCQAWRQESSSSISSLHDKTHVEDEAWILYLGEWGNCSESETYQSHLVKPYETPQYYDQKQLQPWNPQAQEELSYYLSQEFHGSLWGWLQPQLDHDLSTIF